MILVEPVLHPFLWLEPSIYWLELRPNSFPMPGRARAGFGCGSQPWCAIRRGWQSVIFLAGWFKGTPPHLCSHHQRSSHRTFDVHEVSFWVPLFVLVYVGTFGVGFLFHALVREIAGWIWGFGHSKRHPDCLPDYKGTTILRIRFMWILREWGSSCFPFLATFFPSVEREQPCRPKSLRWMIQGHV